LYANGGLSSTAQFQTENSTRVYNVSLFGAYGLPTGLSLSAAVGYSILQSDTQDSEGTVSANVAVSYLFSRAAVSVGVFQDFRQTAQQGQNFGTVKTRSYFGSFLYQWTPFINTVLNVTYSENEPTGTGNQTVSGSQHTLTYGAGVNWQVLRWLTASLQYQYTKQTGGNAFGNDQTGQFGTGDYAENRVTLGLFATF
jgi:opacity protein-like surface antigen